MQENRSFAPNAFEPVQPENRPRQQTRPFLSFWKETALRMRKSPTAIFCMVLLGLIALGAIVFPLFSSFDYAQQNVAFANQPFFSADPLTGAIHWFGTDHLGRDIFIRIWYGARISLTVALSVAIIDCFIGVVYGGIAGYLGGAVDNMMMRVLEVISGIPYMMIVILLMAVFPRGLLTIIIAYSITGWTGMARLVRGQVRSIRQQDFMVAARMMGAGTGRILRRHVVPSLIGIIIVNITLDIPSIIFTEAFLSMLGMGIAPPYPSWGIMASDGIGKLQTYPAQLAVPAVFICLTMLAFNLLGDRLQDAVDPKLRRPLTLGRNSKHKQPKH